MALERLIKKEAPENLSPARILAVDLPNRKVQVQLRDTILWAACDPAMAASLDVGLDVLVGRSSSSHYLVGKVPRTTPGRTTLLEV